MLNSKPCSFILISILGLAVLTLTGVGASSNKSLHQTFKDGVAEVTNLSPIALTIIIAPIVAAFVLGITCYCVCCRAIRTPRTPESESESEFGGFPALKPRHGQPAPIPLTGMVNQTRGCGNKFSKRAATQDSKDMDC